MKEDVINNIVVSSRYRDARARCGVGIWLARQTGGARIRACLVGVAKGGRQGQEDKFVFSFVSARVWMADRQCSPEVRAKASLT